MALRSPVVRAAPAAVLVIAAAAAALTARPQDAPPPTFKSEANYIRVDVYPTLTGAPVTDLRREEFEVSDENVVQTIDAVEHVTIRAASQDLGREPNTVAESRGMLENGRARLRHLPRHRHVEVDASHNIRQPLVNSDCMSLAQGRRDRYEPV
jgi:hypothetical protein